MPDPDMSVWTGRIDEADGPRALRWHQIVQQLAPDSPPGIVLIGFACDEGVQRNRGRVGAKDGPRAIRGALANLAWHQEFPVYDAGDVVCRNGDLEAAQGQLSAAVSNALAGRHRALVLGGGHETAWGTFAGLAYLFKQGKRVGIVNLDAHFDLRADSPPTSGTPFRQIAGWCQESAQPFRYLCLGVAQASNTAALFDTAANLGAEWRTDIDLAPWKLPEALAAVDTFIRSVDAVHLSLDLDVLPAAVMPAVSAPAGRGVALEVVEALVSAVMASPKVIAADIVELNPTFDIDRHGAQTAARLAWLVAKSFT
jgi:formiminoglutamase